MSGRCARLAVLLGATTLMWTQAHAMSQDKSGLSGVWRIEKPVFAVRTSNGQLPPFKPEAQKVYRAHLAARKRGDTSFDSATWCASVGMPRIMFLDAPFQIMARPRYVAFLHQWNWWARIVYLPGALSTDLPGYDQPGPMGLSKGEWNGDTLVVETTQLISSTLIDGAGVPHSDGLKLTERLSLRSRDVLEDRIRIDDPATFTRPWETVVTYRRQPHTVIQEDVCLDRIKAGAPAVRE
jgi:hypothetical protein